MALAPLEGCVGVIYGAFPTHFRGYKTDSWQYAH